MTKLVLMATMVAGLVAFAPQPVAAESCTDGYMKCLNDNHDKEGVWQKLSDIECFARYAKCIGDIFVE